MVTNATSDCCYAGMRIRDALDVEPFLFSTLGAGLEVFFLDHGASRRFNVSDNIRRHSPMAKLKLSGYRERGFRTTNWTA